MSIKNKLNMALEHAGISKKSAAEHYGIDPYAMRNKFSRDSFSAEDLIFFANISGAKLYLEFDDGLKIPFNLSDIKENPQKK